MAKKAKLDILEVNIDQLKETAQQSDDLEGAGATGETPVEMPGQASLIMRIKPWLSKPWVLLLVVLLMLTPVVAGILLWLVQQEQEKALVHSPETAVSLQETQDKDRMIQLDGFAVDQRNEQGQVRIAFCDVAIELENSESMNMLTEKTEVRRLIYTVLKRRKAGDLLSLEKRTLLKEDLKIELNQLLGENMVRQVYITKYEIN